MGVEPGSAKVQQRGSGSGSDGWCYFAYFYLLTEDPHPAPGTGGR